MEIHIRFTYDLPENQRKRCFNGVLAEKGSDLWTFFAKTTSSAVPLTEALGIDEFTAFSAFVEDGRLIVETEGCEESRETFDDGYDEGMCAGLEEGYADGFKHGYRKGWSDREKGLPYDDTDDEPDDCPYPDRLCENCPQCRTCHWDSDDSSDSIGKAEASNG